MTRIVEPLPGHFEERLLAELKEAVASRQYEQAAVRHRTRQRRARQFFLAAAMVAVSGAIAVALVGVIGPRPRPGGAGYSLAADFLLHAASAARVQNTPLPSSGQVFYIKQVQSFQVSFDGRTTASYRTCALSWNLTPLTGQHQLLPVGDMSCPLAPGVPVPPASYPQANVTGGALVPLYPPLASLPDSPDRLLSTLEADASPAGPYGSQGPYSSQTPYVSQGITRTEVVYTLIGNLLEAPVSGALRAALYEVTAGLRGVTMVARAKDATGRIGTGIRLTMLGAGRLPYTIEFIITPGTYRFLGRLDYGYVVENQDGGSVYESASTADVSSGLVPRSWPGSSKSQVSGSGRPVHPVQPDQGRPAALAPAVPRPRRSAAAA